MAQNMVIELGRAVEVTSFIVQGEVSRPRKRDEIQAVLLLARENARGIDADLVSAKLLGNRKALAVRLVRVCVELGLLDSARGNTPHRLTDAGKRAVEDAHVFVPEYGHWRVWLTSDPLAPHPLLRIDAWTRSPTAVEERRGLRDADNGGDGTPQPVETPNEVRALCGKVVTPVLAGTAPVLVGEMAENAEVAVSDSSLRVCLRLTPTGRNAAGVDGTLEGAKATGTVPVPDVAHADVWRNLLEAKGLNDDWCDDRGSLAVGFDDLDESELGRFRTSVAFDPIRLRDLGVFEGTTVRDVAIAPRTIDDATQWAEWLAVHSIDTYQDAAEFEEKWRAAARSFPAFELQMPERYDLALRLRAGTPTGAPPSPQFWYLVAPIDWRL